MRKAPLGAWGMDCVEGGAIWVAEATCRAAKRHAWAFPGWFGLWGRVPPQLGLYYRTNFLSNMIEIEGFLAFIAKLVLGNSRPLKIDVENGT